MTEQSEITTSNPSISLQGIAGQWGWLLLIGFLTLLTGIAAIAAPHIASLATEMLVGWLLIFNGLLRTIYAFKLRSHEGLIWKLITALLGIAVGLLLLIYPLTGIVSLTLVIGLFFLLSGILEIIQTVHLRSLHGSGWLLFSGTVDIALAALVFYQWPETATWLIGILVGVNLIFSSSWLISLSIAARNWSKNN